MAQVTNGDTMQELIVQAEQRGLLDAVDNLRRLGLGSSIDLPQLIVVGNQGEAKTSVLEAITGARLTTQDYNDDFVIRFATELVLRTSPTVKVVVEIHAGSLLAFGQTSLDKDDLSRIIHEAKRHWAIGHGSKTPSSDALMRVEISGPDVPQLTLIDLPGFPSPNILHQPSPQDSLDIQVTEVYMSKKTSIILAIVQAHDQSQTELVAAQRRVMLKAKQHDPSGCRTLGIITEPENLEDGSISEQKYVLLTRNKKPGFRLARGYHVLCNRARKENDLSRADRDEAERAFFQQPGSAWSVIPSKDREADALREKLGRILAAHIQEQLPYLVTGIEGLVKQREQDLANLGGPRVSIKDQRRYLTTVTSLFHGLAGDAIRGNYSDQSFFGDMYDEGNALTANTPKTNPDIPVPNRMRKLRSLIRDANRAFHFVISTNGAKRQIIWPEGGHHYTCTPVVHEDNVPEPPKHLQPFIAAYRDCNRPAAKLRLADLEGELSQGIFSDDLALRLFLDQSQPWEGIAMRHLEIVLGLASRFAEELVGYVCSPGPVVGTGNGNGGQREAGDNMAAEMLGRTYIDPYFERRKKLMVGKLAELLRPYKGREGYRGNLGGGSGEFTSRVKELKKEKEGPRAHRCCAQRFGGGEGNAFRKDGGDGVKELVLGMQVYYDMSLSTFVDNVKLLAIEDCLINDIPNTLTPEMVLDMSDDMVQRIATESPQVERSRENLRRRLDKLQEGLEICQKHRPRQSVGLSHLLPQDSINPEDLLDAMAKDNEQATSPTAARGPFGLGLHIDAKPPTNRAQFAGPKVLSELTTSPVKMFHGPTGHQIRGYGDRNPAGVPPIQEEITDPHLDPYGFQQKPQPQIYRPYRPLAVQPPPNARTNHPVKRMTLFRNVNPADTWNDKGFYLAPHAPTPTKPLNGATTFGPRPAETGKTQNAPFHLVSFNTAAAAGGGFFTPYNSKATIDGYNDDGVAFLPEGLLQSEELFPREGYGEIETGDQHPCLRTIRPYDTGNKLECPYPIEDDEGKDDDKASTDDSIVALKSWTPLGRGGKTAQADEYQYGEADVEFWNQAQFLSVMGGGGDEKWSLEEVRFAEDVDGTTAAGSEDGEWGVEGRSVLVIE